MENDTAHVAIDHAQAKRLLIVKLSSMGDIIHVTPCIKGIRKSFPNAKIDMVVYRDFAALVHNNPNIDRLITCDRRVDAQALFDRDRNQYDIAIDFQGTIRSRFVVDASGASVKTGSGRARRGWVNMIQPDMSRHAIEVCAQVAACLDIEITDLDPEIYLSTEVDRQLCELLHSEGLPEQGFLLINPFSAWEPKDWPMERYVELISLIRDESTVPIIITGAPNEVTKAAAGFGPLGSETACSLVGRLRLDMALCLYKRAALMITGDSGPMHAAAALGTRVIALFGPTHPERTGPWKQQHAVIQRLRPPRHHEYRRDKSRKYIGAIDTATVYSAVKRALNDKPSHAQSRR